MFRNRKNSASPHAWSGMAMAVLLGVLGAFHANANADPQIRVPLHLFWNGIDDNYSSVNTSIPGYERIRVEARILRDPWPGTVPLQLYLHSGRNDYLLTGPESENSVKAAGYTKVRTEGYVFQGPIPGTVPLKTYWNSTRGDHANVASAQSEIDQQKSGYTYLRTEGYVFAANDPDFGAKKLRLEMFETPSLLKSETAFKTSFVVHPDWAKTGCQYSWIGTIFKTNPHDVVLTICDTGVVGRVQVSDNTYEVNPRKMSRQLIFEGGTPPAQASASHGKTIDIAIGYTSRVLNTNTKELNALAAGATVPAMTPAGYTKANVQLAVDHLNAVFGASGIPATMRLANTHEFKNVIEDSFSGVKDALERLAPRPWLPCGDGNDPYGVHAFRNFVGADLVSIWLDDSLKGMSTGRAYVSETTYWCDQVNGYSVVKAGSAVNNLSFAHETGHNFGALHGAGDEEYGDPFQQPAYAHGYTDTSSGFYTIMASGKLCPTTLGTWCPQVPYYSNPLIRLDPNFKGWSLTGRPMGSSSSANNARRIREESGPVSAYKSLRCPASTSGCIFGAGGGAPSGPDPEDPPILVK